MKRTRIGLGLLTLALLFTFAAGTLGQSVWGQDPAPVGASTGKVVWYINGRPVYPSAPAPAAKPAAAKPVPQPPVILPPPEPEAPAEAAAPGALPTGVDPTRLSPTPKYSVSGAECDQRACYGVLGAETIIDDSRKDTVSVIDPDPARRRQVVEQVRRTLGDSVKTWEGPPTDWSFRDGHKSAGPFPVIYCQAPTGETIHRQDGLEGLPEALEAIRKRHPDYRPERDPDLRKPAPVFPGLPDLSGNGWAMVALGIVVLVVLLRK